MIILVEKKKPSAVNPVYLTEAQKRAMKEAGLLEASNLPAIAKHTGIANFSKYSAVARADTIFSTLQSMGLSPYVNKLHNVVCEAPSMQDAPAIMSAIYQSFGVKSSVTITWEGKVKIYWSPETPIDKAPALAYAKATGLPPPPLNNPRALLA
jgi:hypothetical protein